MNGALATATIVAGLTLAAWGGLTALLDRPPGRTHVWGAGLVEALLAALAGSVLIGLAGGGTVAEPVLFAGYLLTTLALLPAAVILARMEPSRWGSAIVGGAALVVPVLILRLQQLHG
ncbi:MAG TPA: hypothetical protein VES42_00305 [Pilimelia sp.]|nr:hypothetical protein [Pilimelia sp.]